MSLRWRLVLIMVLSIGVSFALSVGVLLQTEAKTTYTDVAARTVGLLSALSAPLSLNLTQGRIPDIDGLMAGLDERRDLLELDELWVLDHKGTVVATLTGKERSARLEDPFSRRAQTSPVPVLDWQDSRVGRVGVPLHSGLRWGTLIAQVATDRIDARIARSRWRIGMIALVVTLLGGLVLSWGLSRFVIRPLKLLTSVAEQWAVEDEAQPRADTTSGGEIGFLGAVMNGAMDKIRGHRKDLEAQVASRTAELESTLSELQQANVRLEQLATTDGLTGLFNHRYFREVLTKELVRQRRGKKPLALLMCDVDHFKHYNDTHGHPAGDVVLKSLAELLNAGTREADVVARYGGEEFVVLLLETGRDDALIRAEQLRASIAMAELPHHEQQPLGCLSVSIGVAVWPDDAVTADALVKRADEALYKSKSDGRNRVTSAQPLQLRDQDTASSGDDEVQS